MYTVNGKQYDYNSTTNQRIKEKFVGNNIYANVTMMTDYILRKADYGYDPDAPFSYDDIENYQVSVCPNCGCSEEFDETAVCDIPIKPEPNPDFDPDREESDDNPKMLYPCPICGITYPDEESAYDCCSHIDYVYMCPECGEYTENLSDIDSEYQEIYEWYLVNGWFADKLAAHGEPVIRDGDICGCLWGRTCTGQAILLDYVISVICEELEILEGQSHEWKID